MKTLAKLTLAAAATIGFASSSQAATILYNDFSSTAGLQLNASTAVINSGGSGVNDGSRDVLRLTNNLGQSGSAFSTNTVSLDNDASFSTAFVFNIGDPQGAFDPSGDGQGADGIVFVVQTVSNTAGGGGVGIGYSGLSNSVGIEFDTWNNGSIDGSNGNHVGINVGGNINSAARGNVATRMNNGADWYAWVDYNGITDLLEVRINQTNIRPTGAFISHSVDLVTELGSTDAFVGFTSGTGAAAGDHDIVQWQFNSTFDPISEIGVPTPGALALLGLSLMGLGSLRRKQI